LVGDALDEELGAVGFVEEFGTLSNGGWSAEQEDGVSTNSHLDYNGIK
jgi:hypothetical protein